MQFPGLFIFPVAPRSSAGVSKGYRQRLNLERARHGVKETLEGIRKMGNYLRGLLHGWWLGFMLGAVFAIRNEKKRNEDLMVDNKTMKPEDYQLSA